MKKELNNLIKELEYAKKLHDKDAENSKLSQSQRIYNKKVSQQKSIIIEALKGKILATNKHIKILKKWRGGHWKWVEYFAHYYQKPKLNKKKEEELIKDEKENGGINWHLRWITNYWWAIYYLEKFKNKE